MRNLAIWGAVILVVLVGAYILLTRGSFSESSSTTLPQTQSEQGQESAQSQSNQSGTVQKENTTAGGNAMTKLQPPSLPE